MTEFLRARMRVAYDGAPFHGFARNPGVRTVQGDLEAALGKVLRHPAELSCAGRTDAGVHAVGQVVSFDADASHFEPVALRRALNRMLAPSIVVDRVEPTAADFDARRACTARTYRYHVLSRAVGDPLLHHLLWHVPEPLDLDTMNEAAAAIIGSHDFAAFSKRNKSRPDESFVRRVEAAEWTDTGPVNRFEITANAFTHQMVRSLVGLLVEVGRGRRPPTEVEAAFAAGSREALPSPAPPRGLVLWEARYD